MSLDDQPPIGLRERKKAKTRAAMQQHALRLFRERGYEATTVEQIAEAAEVSASTFFRYFSTKEDVVLYDALDPLMIAAFKAQPAELSPVQALRGATHAVFAALPPEEMEDMRERFTLISAVPELRAHLLNEFSATIQLAGEMIAQRVGLPVDDFAVRIFAGALIGVSLAVMLSALEDPTADMVALFDAGLAQLEAGLPV